MYWAIQCVQGIRRGALGVGGGGGGGGGGRDRNSTGVWVMRVVIVNYTHLDRRKSSLACHTTIMEQTLPTTPFVKDTSLQRMIALLTHLYSITLTQCCYSRLDTR